jgi:predicted O-methyltransferase YrrM
VDRGSTHKELKCTILPVVESVIYSHSLSVYVTINRSFKNLFDFYNKEAFPMVSEQVSSYISSLIKARNPLLTEMEQYAKEHEVPIMDIVSIEKRYKVAEQFIKRANLESRVSLIYGDALEVMSDIEQFGPFDCLFIDAAKGQYKRFFELYSPFVQQKGLIISDNVLFKGIVANEGKIAKGIRTMVTNLRTYNEMLMANNEYETTFYPIGDGMAISKKK